MNGDDCSSSRKWVYAQLNASASATRNDRYSHGMTGLQDLAHLLLRLRERHHHRQLAIGRQAVALVRPGILFLVQDRARRQEAAQRAYDR